MNSELQESSGDQIQKRVTSNEESLSVTAHSLLVTYYSLLVHHAFNRATTASPISTVPTSLQPGVLMSPQR
jgi:hypothetical protein